MMEGKETAHLVAWVSIFICIALVLHKDLLLPKAEVFIGKVTPYSASCQRASLLFTLALLSDVFSRVVAVNLQRLLAAHRDQDPPHGTRRSQRRGPHRVLLEAKEDVPRHVPHAAHQ